MSRLTPRVLCTAVALALPALLPTVSCSTATHSSARSDAGAVDATTATGAPTATGTVVDSTGVPLGGVAVNIGSAKATTAADGTYSLTISTGAPQIFAFRKTGYVGRTLAYGVDAGQQVTLNVSMLAETAPQSIDATAGGTVKGPRGASLTIPPASLVDSTGKVVTGTVQVSLTPVDPSVPAELAAYPAGLEAENKAGQYGYLVTHGVLEIQVTQGTETLNLKPGTAAPATIPAPAGDASPPATTGTWSLDETTGIWKAEASATLDAATHLYSLSLPHLSAWNCDDWVAPGCIYGQAVDAQGRPLSGASILAFAKDALSSGTTFADQQGYFCLSMAVDQTGTTLDIYPHPQSNPRLYYPKFIGGLPNHEVTESVYMCNDPTQCAQLGKLTIATNRPPTGLDGGLITGVDAGLAGDSGAPGEGPACTLGGDAGAASSDGGSMSPLTGCLAGLNKVFSCFAPSGGCTQTLGSSTSMTSKWTSGSKISWLINGSMTTGTFYSPAGLPCGGIVTSGGSGATITDESGYAWLFSGQDAGADAGEVVTCEPPGGSPTQVTLSPAGSSTASACTGGFGFGAGGGCAVVNPVGAPCPDGPTDCTTSAPDCCAGKAGPICLPASACPAYQANGCGKSSDCTTAGDSCCQIGGTPFPLCVPLACASFDGGTPVDAGGGSSGDSGSSTCTQVACSMQLSDAVTETFPCQVSAIYTTQTGTVFQISASKGTFSSTVSVELPGAPSNTTTYTKANAKVAGASMQQGFDGGIPDGGKDATVVTKGWDEAYSPDGGSSNVGTFQLYVKSAGPSTTAFGVQTFGCIHGTFTATMVSEVPTDGGLPVQMSVTF